MTTIPTYEQLAELPVVLTGRVGPEHLDANGHMNIAHYFELGNRTLLARFEPLGLGTGAGVDDHGMTTFTTEHHLRYHAELGPEEEYSCHALLIGRAAKVLHAIALVVSRTHRRLAYCFEAMIINVDLSTRRAAPFRPEVASALDQAIEADQTHVLLGLTGAAIRIR